MCPQPFLVCFAAGGAAIIVRHPGNFFDRKSARKDSVETAKYPPFTSGSRAVIVTGQRRPCGMVWHVEAVFRFSRTRLFGLLLRARNKNRSPCKIHDDLVKFMVGDEGFEPPALSL